MKRLVSFTMLCASLPLAAQTLSPWNGTWTLNRAKSHLSGTTFTNTKDAEGMWTESFGTLSIKFVPDGKPYPLFDKDHTITVTMPDAHTQKIVSQLRGKTTSVSTDILSADGKTLSQTEIDTKPDGITYKSSELDKRVGQGEGFLGKWTSEKVSSTGSSPTTIVASADSITFSTPAEKYTLSAQLNGSPATPVGPDMTAGLTLSYRKTSATRLDWTASLNDKVVGQGFDEVAANGKSYTNTSWLIGSESEKTVSYFAKQ